MVALKPGYGLPDPVERRGCRVVDGGLGNHAEDTVPRQRVVQCENDRARCDGQRFQGARTGAARAQEERLRAVAKNYCHARERERGHHSIRMTLGQFR